MHCKLFNFSFIQLDIDEFSYNLLFQKQESVNWLDEKLISVEIQNNQETNLVVNEEVANRVVSKTVCGLTPANDENEDRGFYRMSTYFGIKKKKELIGEWEKKGIAICWWIDDSISL